MTSRLCSLKRGAVLSVAILFLLSSCVVRDNPKTAAVPAVRSERSPQAPALPASAHSPVLGRMPSYPFGVPPTGNLTDGPRGAEARALDLSRPGRAGAYPVPHYADCDEGKLGGLAGADLVDYLVTVDGPCVNRLFQSNAVSWHAFAPANVGLVAERANRLAASWDGHTANGLWPLAVYLKAAYYLQYNAPDKVGPLSQSDAAVLRAVDTLLANSALWRAGAEDNGTQEGWLRNTDARGVASETLILIDSVRNTDLALPLIGRFFRNYTLAARGHWAEDGVLPLQIALYNLHYADDFASRIDRGDLNDLLGHLYRLVDAGPGVFSDTRLYRNTLRETGRFLKYPRTAAAVESRLAARLAATPRLSPEWVEIVYDFENMGKIPCQRYGLCTARDEVSAKLFPNRWVFDNGALEFQTALGKADVQQLYYAMKAVRSQFMRLNGETSPVPGDPNPVLKMVIYASPGDYQAYQPFLNNLSTNNGGIYIEPKGTFYTYQRQVPQESYLTLEELVRHEYVHYLAGRFMMPGMWGDPPFYSDALRMPWFDEGLAEFLTWSTLRDGIKVRGHIVRPVAQGWPDDFSRPADIMRSSYDSGFNFYNHSALWFYYLYRREPAELIGLMKAVRRGDAASFDARVTRLGGDAGREASFKGYVDDQVALYRGGALDDTSTVLGRDWVEPDRWQMNRVSDIGAALGRVLSLGCTEMAMTPANLTRRFECRGNLVLTSGDDVAARAQAASRLDAALDLLYRAGPNNFMATLCEAGDYNPAARSATVRCEGPLAMR
ncbi:collagenase [Paludibacterium paludis]|uniref:microbial collagenase n=1 Tax=Paludibacterium paludis TaxID=1225769 RepID=A0A918P6U9_9NEIS|nr:collagenase [Paludibacterium paludis]GGY24080.1 collagenase [Paludibacterium paludis]